MIHQICDVLCAAVLWSKKYVHSVPGGIKLCGSHIRYVLYKCSVTFTCFLKENADGAVKHGDEGSGNGPSEITYLLGCGKSNVQIYIGLMEMACGCRCNW